MKRRVLLIFIIAVAAVGAACQPTPEKEIVVNKADGRLQEKIESTSVSTTGNKSAVESTAEAETEERWEAFLQKGNVNINIDAEVVVPDVGAYPVLSIAPIEMNQEWADKALDIFFQGATPYEREMTKQAIETKILINKRVMEQIKAGNLSGGFAEGDYALFKEEIDVLMDIYKTAPDSNDLTPANTVFEEAYNGQFVSKLLSLMAKVNKSSFAYLIIMNNLVTKTNYIQFYNYDNNEFSPTFSIKEYTEGTQLDNVSISLKEAQEMANDIIAQMGITGVELIDTNVVNILEVKSKINHNEVFESDNQAYEFVYARIYNGINVSYFDSRMKVIQTESDPDPEAYSAVLEPERLKVRVDDSGIIFFDWKNSTFSDGIISENVELLDFEKIKEIFSNQIFYHQFYGSSESSLDIYIDKIVLSYFIQPVKDNNDKYMAIPVWDFINEASGEHNSGRASTYLTINAIDGSVINRDLGY